MLRLGTVFSGIGAVEHALERLNIPYEIQFACDNGERKLKAKYEEIEEITKGMNNSERNAYITQLYNQTGVNYVEQTYKANVNFRPCEIDGRKRQEQTMYCYVVNGK